ncbi:hypothetical protein ACFYO2_46225 [Streptomyces sp. NPDC006602]|uniref:hypothetical protein n=1 Tax=Streptomyces sp. NPDC006602 TaxID=3364751 RepID=UPI0036CB02C5
MSTLENEETLAPQPVEEAQQAASDADGAVPGSAAAALLACGVASTVLGAAVVASDANLAAKEWFTLHEGVGPLAGKTTLATVAYLLSWLVLHVALRRRTVRGRTTVIATAALVTVGLLFTFPPIYQIWAIE